jgi:hypothetical protein
MTEAGNHAANSSLQHKSTHAIYLLNTLFIVLLADLKSRAQHASC